MMVLHRWVVSYDISDDKIRQKVAKTLMNYGDRVQYSVFECDLKDNELRKLIDKFSQLIEKEDSIRYYRLCPTCRSKAIVIGKADLYLDTDYLII